MFYIILQILGIAKSNTIKEHKLLFKQRSYTEIGHTYFNILDDAILNHVIK